MWAIAIFVDVLLLDQLYLGLCGRHRGSSCLSLRHTGLENDMKEAFASRRGTKSGPPVVG
jgi:hypothetical protein